MKKNNTDFWNCWKSKFEVKSKCSQVDGCVDRNVIADNNNNNNNIHICIAPYGRNFRGAEVTTSSPVILKTRFPVMTLSNPLNFSVRL